MPKFIFVDPLVFRRPVTQPANKVLATISPLTVVKYGVYLILCFSIYFHWCGWLLQSTARRVTAQLGDVKHRMHRSEPSMELQLVRQMPDPLNHLERASETLLQFERAS